MSERRLDSERESLREASDDGSVRGGATAEDAEGRGGRGGEQGAIGGIGRREALKVLATSAVALPLAGSLAACSPESRSLPVVDASKAASGGVEASGVPVAGPRGTKSDPDLLNPKITWPMLLTASEMVTLTALCDMIIPADATSPAASAVGVPAYINEYVSAPADWYQRALVQVRGGLIWINVESNKRFGKAFADVTPAQRTAICDDICYAAKAKPEFKQAAQFFDRVRDLTAEGFYTTDEGMKDIGYVGNVALASFDGPPPEVLKHLGLA
ncbi:MAG: gluconate 2-dehydrogenase subunit 3 family protein [Gemmatimonadetes bacterium]|nr:gluconate 2-dehydrogenase subunit 3 family protein [Gemmatimonadota bacterium]